MNVKVFGADFNEDIFRDMFADEITFRKLDFYDEDTYDECLRGINSVFLMRPPQISRIRKYMKPFIKKMAEHKIEHVVSLSIVGANILTPHYRMEKKVEKYGLPYTHIRAGFFMQNLITTHLEIIRKENKLCIPAGDGKTSFIDARDIAEVAAMVLKTGNYKNDILRVTGLEALDYYEVAKRMSSILDRKITYTAPSTREFKKKMKVYGYEKKFLRIVSILYLTVRLGKASTIYYDVEKVLGREPKKIDEFIRDYKPF